MKNRYIIEDDIVKIFLNSSFGEYYTVIDLDDFEQVSSIEGMWCLRSPNDEYAQRNIRLDKVNGKWRYTTSKLHDEIMNCPKGMRVDHINHDGLNNRRMNLRITNAEENDRHRGGRNSNNSTGYRNVAYVSRDKHPYYVQLMIDGKNTVLGKFDDVDEAGAFAKDMRHKYYGKFQGRG